MDKLIKFIKKKYLTDHSMSGAMAISIGLHLFVLLLITVSFPFLSRDIPDFKPLNVEIVDIDEISQSTPQKKAEEQAETPPKPPKAPEKPTPPTMTEDAPPDLTKPKPKPEEEPVKEEEKAQEEPTPEPPKVKPQVKPKPPEKKEQPNKPKPEEKQDDFQSLLKNLTPEEVEPEASKELDDIIREAAQAENRPDAGRLSNRLTLSEEDALRAQLARCWNVMAGAKYAENLVVEVFVQMRPDRTVHNASILDKSRYNRDSAFKAAADSALRALRNPACVPLALPPEKYDQWKTITIRFDPREML